MESFLFQQQRWCKDDLPQKKLNPTETVGFNANKCAINLTLMLKSALQVLRCGRENWPHVSHMVP